MLVYDEGTITQLATTPATSGGITQVIGTEPIIVKILANYANVCKTLKFIGCNLHI